MSCYYHNFDKLITFHKLIHFNHFTIAYLDPLILSNFIFLSLFFGKYEVGYVRKKNIIKSSKKYRNKIIEIIKIDLKYHRMYKVGD